MTHKKGDAIILPSDDMLDVESSDAISERGSSVVRKSDPNAFALLNTIAKHLDIPVEQFFGTPANLLLKQTVQGENLAEQEQRLLSALRRMTDGVMRQNLVELAETLAPAA